MKPQKNQQAASFSDATAFLNNPEAEQHLLGVCLSDRTSLQIAIGSLNDSCFSTNQTKAVFKALCNLGANDGIPATLMIVEAAKPYATVKAADLIRWKVLAEGESVESLIALLQKYRQHRELSELCYSTVEQSMDVLSDPTEISQKLQSESQKIITVENTKESESRHEDILLQIEKIMQGVKEEFIPTYLGKLDREMLSGGYEKGTLNILAARSRVGKSAVALFMLYMNQLKGVKGGFVSMEMNHDQIARREYSMRTSIPYARIKSAELSHEELQALKLANYHFMTNHFYRECCGVVNITRLRAIISRMVYNHGCRFVVIDYLQRMDIDISRGQNYATSIGIVVNQIKAMAAQFNIPIILLSQLNRNSERDGREPGLFDLRDSGMIEEAADTILMLDRPELRDENPTTKDGESLAGKMVLLLEKNRDGEGNTRTYINADMACNLFADYAQPKSTPF